MPAVASSGEKPESLSAMLEPLKNVQVWRFSLYYFFVFGGFVSLALWLPHYLIGVYGVGIAAAGAIGAAYSIPASVFRAYGGHLSDKFGARRVMYWTFLVSHRLHVHPVVPADPVCDAGQSMARSPSRPISASSGSWLSRPSSASS